MAPSTAAKLTPEPVIRNPSPVTGKLQPAVKISSAADVKEAVEAAREAQKAWADLGFEARATGGLISNLGPMNVRSDAGFTSNFDGTMSGGGSPTGSLTIDAGGSFTKSGGTGTTFIGPSGSWYFLNNNGTGNVQTGTLAIGAGSNGGTHTGLFNLSSGATLDLGGIHHLNAGTSFAGAGPVIMFSTINANTTVAIPMPLTLAGTLQGTGTVNASGAVTWRSGTMTNTSTTNILASIAIDTAGTKFINYGRTVNIGDSVGAAGSVTASWSGGAITNLGPMNVRSDAAFTTSFDGSMQGGGSPGGALNIHAGGSFTKNGGTGTTSIGTDGNWFSFNNSGTVNVDAGVLTLSAGGANTGTIDADAGTTVTLGSTVTLDPASALTGQGTLTFTGGFPNTVVGTLCGYWAYETLNFGGYWNWDPVENAVYVPWLVLIASIHTMIIYKNSQAALKTAMILNISVFVLILYSTFLTCSGILGDASVHSFTDLGLSGQLLIYLFTVVAVVLAAIRWKEIPSSEKEASIDSREFWIFLGATTLCLMGFQVLLPTSIPVYNSLVEVFGGESNLAPPADQIGFYSKFQLWFGVLVALISGTGQFFWWKRMEKEKLKKEILPPILISLIVFAIIISIARVYEPAYVLLTLAGVYLIVSNLKVLSSVIKVNLRYRGDHSHTLALE